MMINEFSTKVDFCELNLINAPMQLLWQNGSGTVFGPKRKQSQDLVLASNQYNRCNVF